MGRLYFSVVIPLYNKEKHIKRAIDSILNQSYQKFEIIVVDDGSEDDGVIKVEEYEDSRIKLIKQSNKGVSAARNIGIKNAKYDYIGFLDADDVWKKDFLKEIYFLIKDYPNKAAYATGYESYLENGSIKKAKYSNTNDKFRGVINNYFKNTLKNSLFSSSSVVIRREIFKDIGYFDESLKLGEDLDMWFRIALKKESAFINKSLATYYRNADNRACNNSVDYSSDFIKKIIENIDYYKLPSNKFNQKYINHKLIQKSKNFMLNNEKEYSRKILTYVSSKKKIILFLCSYIPSKILRLAVKLKNILKNKFKL
jgi:glycosyltransferase involved in cell wall biosynthesis